MRLRTNMTAIQKWLSLFIISLFTSLFLSCGNEEAPANPTDPTDPIVTALSNYAWEEQYTDINISPSEDYADIMDQTVTLYFLNETEGVCRVNINIVDTEGDQWGTQNELSHFNCTIVGNNITVYLENPKNTLKLTISDNAIYNEDFTFTKRAITNDDKKYLPLTGDCGKGDNKISYTYWPWGELFLEGEGEMMDYTSGTQPWANRTVKEVSARDSKITSIGANFLNGFSELAYIELPQTVKKIGAHAFDGCISLEYVNGSNFEPDVIEEYAFAGCKKLNVPNISECKSLGAYAYYECSELMIISEIKKLEEIGDFAFFGCSSISVRNLVFPETLKKIGRAAFSGVDFYTLTLPESLVELGEGAFMHGKIGTIYIGKNLSKFDDAILTEVTNGTLTINQSVPPTVNSPLTVMTSTGALSGWTLRVPENAAKSYKSNNYWNQFKIVEDSSLSEKGDSEGGGDDNVTGSEDERLDIEYAKSPLRGDVSSEFRGSGTINDPYLIATAADLRLLSDKVRGGNIYKNTYFKQIADITINQNVLTTGGSLNGNGSRFEQWIPIGRKYPSYFFCGNYDGNGHTISGLYYNRENGENGGLFGKVFGKATAIKNLTIKDSYFRGGNYIGTFVGDISAKRDGTTVSSTINDYYKENCNVGISYCKSYATVEGNSQIGGIVGHCADGSSDGRIRISYCANYGKISGQTQIGGLLGYGSFHNGNSQLSYLYNEGSVIATTPNFANAGGICGYGTAHTIISSLNRGTINGSYNTGGILGASGSSAYIQGVLNIGVIKGEGKLGQLTGNIRTGEITNSIYMSSSAVPAWGEKGSNVSTKGTSRCSDDELKSKTSLDKLNKVKNVWISGQDGYPTLKWLSE